MAYTSTRGYKTGAIWGDWVLVIEKVLLKALPVVASPV